jgi:hypothetical protein
MYDRFARDGQPKAFDRNSILPDLYPVRSRFIRNVMTGTDVKGVIVKGHLKSRGAHHVFHDERPARHMFEISHYKWNDRALQRVQAAHDQLSKAGAGWAFEYGNVLDHYRQHGRFAWETFGGEVVGREKRGHDA